MKERMNKIKQHVEMYSDYYIGAALVGCGVVVGYKIHDVTNLLDDMRTVNEIKASRYMWEYLGNGETHIIDTNGFGSFTMKALEEGITNA